MFNPPSAWPSDVASLTERLANRNVQYGGIRNRQGSARTALGWMDLNERALNVPFGDLAHTIRARLDLPPAEQDRC